MTTFEQQVINFLVDHGLPLTRENYARQAYPDGEPGQDDWDDEDYGHPPFPSCLID